MDTGWIPVFVLSLSECVAPAGKTVCQQQELTIEFADQAQCELVLEQLVSLKQAADNVIVEPGSARCTRSAREVDVFDSLDELSARHGSTGDWRPPDRGDSETPDFTVDAHRKRLDDLDTCEATGGAAPCKVGEIIVEGPAVETLEVWRRDE